MGQVDDPVSGFAIENFTLFELLFGLELVEFREVFGFECESCRDEL